MSANPNSGDLKRLMRELGEEPAPGSSNSGLVSRIETLLNKAFATKGIAQGTTIRFGPKAPATVAGRELVVASLEFDWYKSCPRVALGANQGLYTALTVAKYATVVR